MKGLFVSLFAVLLSMAVNAQEGSQPKTLLDGKALSVSDLGFYVAPSIGFAQMDGGFAALGGGRFGLSLGKQWSFGFVGLASMNQIMPSSETMANVYMDYWATGGFVEYTLHANRLVHFTFPVSFAYGEVQMDNEMGFAGLGEANFFQVEPAALLEVNLHKYVRMHAGLSYRLVGEMTYRNLNQTDLSGLTAQLGLRFGLFR